MTVGDYLVNSLTAQSLDLPPAVSLEGRQGSAKMRLRGLAGAWWCDCVQRGSTAAQRTIQHTRHSCFAAAGSCTWLRNWAVCCLPGLQAAPTAPCPAPLPPSVQAAQWRQEHRSDAFKQRKLIVWEVDETEPWEGEFEHGRLCKLGWRGKLLEGRAPRFQSGAIYLPTCLACLQQRTSQRVWSRESLSS